MKLVGAVGTLGLILVLQLAIFYARLNPQRPSVFHAILTLFEVGTVWFPITLIALGAMATLKRTLRKLGLTLIAVALLALGLRYYTTQIEPNNLKIRRIKIASAKLKKPIRLLHISDLQSAKLGAYESAVFERLKALNADLIIHTGDIMQPKGDATFESELPKAKALFGQLTPRWGVYNVIGDTDRRLRVPLSTWSELTTLDNQSRTLAIGGHRIRLLGIEPRFSRTTKATLRTFVQESINRDPEAFHLIFAHPPDFIEQIQDLPVDLALAGHTHGGQIRLPLIGPLWIGSRVPRSLGRGLNKVGKVWLNVSAGIGAEHAAGLPSIRLFCPPEVTLIELTPR